MDRCVPNGSLHAHHHPRVVGVATAYANDEIAPHHRHSAPRDREMMNRRLYSDANRRDEAMIAGDEAECRERFARDDCYLAAAHPQIGRTRANEASTRVHPT